MLLLAEAQYFALRWNVELDLLRWFDTRQGLRALTKSALISTVTQPEVFGVTILVVACER